MNTPTKREAVKTTPWVMRKKTKTDDLATVAFLMDQFTREENTEYAKTVKEQSARLNEDNVFIKRQLAVIREQERVIEAMRASLHVMSSVIERNETELRVLQPEREYGYAVAIDGRQIRHAVLIQYPGRIDEFPIEQEIIDLVARENLDAEDSGSETDSDYERDIELIDL